MKKHRLLYIFLVLLGLLCSLVLTASLVLPPLYQERGQALVKEKLSDQTGMVLAPFRLEISGWKNFPHVTISLNNISLVDTAGAEPLQVLAVKHTEVLVPVLQWPFSTFRISRMTLDGVVFHQRVDSAGNKTSLAFRKNEKASDAPGDFQLDIGQIRIRNGRIMSENHFKKSALSFQLFDTDLRAELGGEALQLKGKLKGKINYIASRKMRLFQEDAFTIDASYTYDLRKKLGTIQNSHAILNGNDVLITGTHQKAASGTGSELDLHFQGYQPFFFLLNQMSYVRSIPLLKKVESEGRVKLHYHLAGHSSPVQRTRNRLYFTLQDGKLYWPTSRITLSHIQIAGQLDNGPEHSPESSAFTLHRLSARNGADSVQLKATISNFNKPFVEAQISGSYTLDGLAEVLPPDYISVPSGTLAGKVTMQGNLHAGEDRRKEQDLQWQGAVTLKDVAFQPAKLTVACTDVNGEVRFAGNELRWQQLAGKVGGKPFTMNGSVKDIMNYLLGQRPAVAMDGAIRLQEVKSDWIKLEQDAGATVAGQPVAADTTITILPAFLRLNMRLHCQQLALPAVTVHQLRGRLRSNGKWLTLSDIGLTAQNIAVSGSVTMPNDRRQLQAADLQLSARLDTLDLRSLQQVKAFAGATGPRKATAGTRDLQDLLPLQKSQLDLQIGHVKLPGDEDLENLSLRLHKNRNHIMLRDMRFATSRGGMARANGGFLLTKTSVRKPYLDVAMQYDSLDLQAFMQNMAALKVLLPASETDSASAEPAGRGKLRERVYHLKLQLKAKELKYEYLNGANLAVDARMNRDQAQLDSLYLHAFGGVIYARGIMDLNEPSDTIPVRLKAQVQDVNLKELFVMADQMELDLLGSQNIEGTADCKLAVHMKLDQTFTPSFDQTVAYSRANFRGMELIDVKPIQEALGFMRKERTEHLYFEDMEADFVLYKNKFVAPGFSLNNNLSAIDLRGSYTMKGSANLSLDVNVLNILFGNNERRIEKIQADSLKLNNNHSKQHLLLRREQDKYKVKVSNRKERESIEYALRNEFLDVLKHYQIDTVFSEIKQASSKSE
jgi:uncharacterized protein involved in outer membrane biogenesis